MSLKALIFDMDGLMVDTEPLSRRAWEQVLAAFGYVMDDAVYGRMIGRRADVAVQIFLEHFDLPLTAAETMRRKNDIFQEMLAEGAPIMPGLMELHAEIARRGLPWAVATSSPRAHAEKILTELGLRQSCRAIAAGDEAAHGKPAPDIYLLAAERLGIPPQHCLALEDSAPGCQAAAQAGMTTIAIPNGMTKTAVFPCAHHIFNSLHDVVDNLDALLLGCVHK
ncbi:MAG: HAD family phosphatase [Chloroflexi bacterium]|nr:HAD family phosphatase [Chloroflexota bacterium]